MGATILSARANELYLEDKMKLIQMLIELEQNLKDAEYERDRAKGMVESLKKSCKSYQSDIQRFYGYAEKAKARTDQLIEENIDLKRERNSLLSPTITRND